MTKDKIDFDKVGIVAGNGQFPVLFARAAKKSGIKVYAAAHENETDTGLEAESDSILWVKIGQLERIVEFFLNNHVRHAVMIGGIAKARLYSDFEPDELAMEVLSTIDTTGDDAVLRAIAQALEKRGIQMVASTSIMPQLLAKSGCWTKRQPTDAEMADIEMGFSLAKKIGSLDIGQCVIVGGGSVVAVEAIEGTDAAIMRAGSLGAKNAVVVKVSKPNQDDRFDLPAAGAKTIETMIKSAAATVLAVEANASVIFDKEKMVELADQNKIAIFGIKFES